jgi:hypothetical protein
VSGPERKVELGPENRDAEKLLPAVKVDGSGVGINYADAYLKAIKTTLDDGRKVTAKRRGLKLTLTIGDRSGEGLLRRLQHGPDEKVMLLRALEEAAAQAGARFLVEDGVMKLVISPPA